MLLLILQAAWPNIVNGMPITLTSRNSKRCLLVKENKTILRLFIIILGRGINVFSYIYKRLLKLYRVHICIWSTWMKHLSQGESRNGFCFIYINVSHVSIICARGWTLLLMPELSCGTKRPHNNHFTLCLYIVHIAQFVYSVIILKLIGHSVPWYCLFKF